MERAEMAMKKDTIVVWCQKALCVCGYHIYTCTRKYENQQLAKLLCAWQIIGHFWHEKYCGCVLFLWWEVETFAALWLTIMAVQFFVWLILWRASIFVGLTFVVLYSHEIWIPTEFLFCVYCSSLASVSMSGFFEGCKDPQPRIADVSTKLHPHSK